MIYSSVSITELREEVGLNPDGTLFWKKGRRGRQQSKEAFSTKDTHGYKKGMFNGTRLLAHRVVWALHHGSWPKQWLDHINNDRTDNRIENLREVDATLSNHNRVYKQPFGYRGVSMHPLSSRYKAVAYKDGKRYYLGTFDTAEEAARERDKKVFELYGSDGLLNFPKSRV